jgi:rhodanese-related sulfurtransferase
MNGRKICLQTNTFFLHCAGGYRSMIAASILKSRGIHHFTEIEGGFGAIANLNSSAINFEALELVKN